MMPCQHPASLDPFALKPSVLFQRLSKPGFVQQPSSVGSGLRIKLDQSCASLQEARLKRVWLVLALAVGALSQPSMTVATPKSAPTSWNMGLRLLAAGNPTYFTF